MIGFKISCLVILLLFVSSIAHSQIEEDVPAESGVLVLAHGGSETWNREIAQVVAPLQDRFCLEIALGMAVPDSLEKGLRKLEERRAKRILVIPLFISSYSSIIRQTEYVLSLRPELADEPLLMHHGNSAHEHHANHAAMLKPISTTAKLKMTGALDNHPFVGEILLARAQELSTVPENETVLLVAHGPNEEEDNQKWLDTMNNLAQTLRQQGGFLAVQSVTLRDDAPKEIYETAREDLRRRVLQAMQANNRVLVIPFLLASGGIEKGIPQRLEGLNYIYNGKTLLPHVNITRFVEEKIRENENTF